MWDWLSGKKWIESELANHAEETGEHFELVKAGIPPLRLWIRNSKGDKWGKVVGEDGTEQWVRLRVRVFSKGGPLTFFK